MGTVTIFDRDEIDLLIALAGCTLNKKPGSNWVEDNGGLPEYICRIARAIIRTGKSDSQAIAIAVSRVKKWAAGADDVDADTRAKAAKALAQWEALKVKNKGKKAAKAAARGVKNAGSGDRVEATNPDTGFLCLANTGSFNVATVRSAFTAQTREARRVWRQANPNTNYDDGPPYFNIREMWTDYLIVASEYGDEAPLFKVNYTVDKDSNVTFADPVQVTVKYVVVKDSDLPGADVTDAALKTAMELTEHADRAALDRIVALTAAPERTALQQVVAAHTD